MYTCSNLLKYWILGGAIVLASSIILPHTKGSALVLDGELATPVTPLLEMARSDQSSEVSQLVQGNNAFACDLYRQLSATEGNLFFSPYSISNALAMTYAGARGTTAEEMANVLHFQVNPNRLHPTFAELIAALDPKNNAMYQLAIANRLWGQENYGFLPEFINLTTQYYHAPLQEVDFINATEEVRLQINDWVQQNTQNQIQNLIPEGILDPRTRLVLTNAIYFKGNWEYPFDASATQNQPFHLLSGESVEVPMMHQMEYLNFANLDSLQVLELPYQGDALSMVILLPRAIDGLPQLEQQLTPETLQIWLSAPENFPMMFDEGSVSVWLPRFKLTSTFELQNTLSDLGMPQAFSNQADFSGMNGQPQDLLISNVIHKAFVEVNEQGTEAAAATAVIATTRGASPSVRVDHPFIFLIRDRDSGSILFLGRVVNPYM